MISAVLVAIGHHHAVGKALGTVAALGIALGLAACGGRDTSEPERAAGPDASDVADAPEVGPDASDAPEGVCGARPGGEAGVCAGYAEACGPSCPCCQSWECTAIFGCMVPGPAP
jgi:hypothetical protein